MSSGQLDSTELVAIPRLRESDMVLIRLLLQRAGLLVRSHEPYGEGSVELFVNAADVDVAKQVLAEFRTRDASGNEIPIPW